MEAIFVFVAALLVYSTEVRAQTCYSCASMSSATGNIDLPSEIQGFQKCDSPLQVDCSGQGGGCSFASFDLTYNVDGYGDEKILMVQSSCGIASDQCVGGSELEQALSASAAMINSMIPGDSVTFVSGTGEVCFCTDDICNKPAGGSASSWKINLPTLLVSLLISILAGKL